MSFTLFFISRTEIPDVHVLFVLCILYTQQCLQSEATEILELFKKQDDNFKKSFFEVAIKNWTFLFENVKRWMIRVIIFSMHRNN